MRWSRALLRNAVVVRNELRIEGSNERLGGRFRPSRGRAGGVCDVDLSH